MSERTYRVRDQAGRVELMVADPTRYVDVILSEARERGMVQPLKVKPEATEKGAETLINVKIKGKGVADD